MNRFNFSDEEMREHAKKVQEHLGYGKHAAKDLMIELIAHYAPDPAAPYTAAASAAASLIAGSYVTLKERSGADIAKTFMTAVTTHIQSIAKANGVELIVSIVEKD